MPRLALITCIAILFVTALQADITHDNVYNFLITGELTAEIYVSPGDIDWIEDERATDQRIEQLKTALANNPGDPDIAFELIGLYEQYNRDTESQEIAYRTLPTFNKRFMQDKDETSAVRFAKVALAANSWENNDKAYRAMLPFLESRRARRETCITAIKNRIARQDYNLAKSIADIYIEVYPRYAELYYQRYQSAIGKNVDLISETIRSSSKTYLNKKNVPTIDLSNAEEFVAQYFEDLDSQIDTSSLLKAIELEPSNYEYNLSAAFNKAATYFISKTLIKLMASDVEEEDFERIFRQADPDLLTTLRIFLKRAEHNRPKRDIQVFLAYAFVHMVFGEFDEIEPYARVAINTRPDLPMGYDALLLSSCCRPWQQTTPSLWT